MTTALHHAREALQAALAASRNADGGWGYRAGKRSRVEPTSLALLALGAAPGDGTTDASVLERWERHDGLLIDPAATHPNVGFNGVAALAAQYPPLGLTRTAELLIGALLRYHGVVLPPSESIVQNNALLGWPWLDGTFSWVEPTSWCLVSLKRWSRTHPSLDRSVRIDHGERLLRDRMCREGGWNYGNPLVLGKELMPYAATSALALLALQNRADDPVVQRSRTVLAELCASERSAFALGLSAIAFHVLGDPAATDAERALAGLWADTAFGGDLMATALALYVVNGASDSYEAFRV